MFLLCPCAHSLGLGNSTKDWILAVAPWFRQQIQPRAESCASNTARHQVRPNLPPTEEALLGLTHQPISSLQWELKHECWQCCLRGSCCQEFTNDWSDQKIKVLLLATRFTKSSISLHEGWWAARRGGRQREQNLIASPDLAELSSDVTLFAFVSSCHLVLTCTTCIFLSFIT